MESSYIVLKMSYNFGLCNNNNKNARELVIFPTKKIHLPSNLEQNIKKKTFQECLGYYVVYV